MNKNKLVTFFKKNMAVVMVAFMLTMAVSPAVYQEVNKLDSIVHVDAKIGGSATDNSDKSESALKTAIDDAVAGETFKTTAGGSYKGSQVVKDGLTNDYFTELTSKEQQRMVDLMMNAAQSKSKKDLQDGTSANPVTQTTISDWVSQLSKQNGATSKLLATALDGFHADIAQGSKRVGFLKPFLNGAAGIVVVFIFLMIVFMVTLDLAYLTLPFVNAWVDGEMGGNSGSAPNKVTAAASKFISDEATKISRQGTDLKTSQKLTKYATQKGITIGILLVVVMLFVTGSVFPLIAGFVDVVLGFLGLN